MFKLPHSYTHFTGLQGIARNSPTRFQQYRKRELPEVQAGFRKGRGTRDQIVNIRWIIENAIAFQKKSVLLTMLKPFCGSQQTVDFQEMEIPHYLPP